MHNVRSTTLRRRAPALALFALAAVVVAILSASDTQARELKKGIAIRGIGTNKTCSTQTVWPDDPTGWVQNLSVNCTDATSNKNDYKKYSPNPPYTKFCVARITQIVRMNGSVKTDPIKGNRYHCLVNNIRARDLVGEMTPKP